jgi:hypothetical protein
MFAYHPTTMHFASPRPSGDITGWQVDGWGGHIGKPSLTTAGNISELSFAFASGENTMIDAVLLQVPLQVSATLGATVPCACLGEHCPIRGAFLTSLKSDLNHGILWVVPTHNAEHYGKRNVDKGRARDNRKIRDMLS